MFVVFGHSSGDDTIIGVPILRSLVLIGPNLSATYIGRQIAIHLLIRNERVQHTDPYETDSEEFECWMKH